MVQFGENTHVVPLSSVSDAKALAQAIRASFKDVLQPGQNFFYS